MRYAACTHEDIKFLKSRIAGRRSDQPKLSNRDIRNVSIITALNAQKDRINELGSVRFAAEMGQSLTHFYSIDRFGSPPDVADNRPKRKKSKVSGKHVSDEISHTLRKKHLGSTSICFKSFPRKAITLHWYACHNQQ